MLDHRTRILLQPDAHIFLEPTLSTAPRDNSCQTAFPLKEWKTRVPTSHLSSWSSVNMDKKTLLSQRFPRGRGVGVPRALPNSLSSSELPVYTVKAASKRPLRRTHDRKCVTQGICSWIVITWSNDVSIWRNWSDSISTYKCHTYCSTSDECNADEIYSFRVHITTIIEIQRAKQKWNELDYPSCCFCFERYDYGVCYQ